MHSLHPELTHAMSAMLNKRDSSLRSGGCTGSSVSMHLAGGMAVHFHCGTRCTENVDASFSARLLISAKDLTVVYVREDGLPSTLYFDANYNGSFALMHPDYRENSVEWEGIGNETLCVHLRVLAPIDLAVSKITRFSEQDQADIHPLADAGLISPDKLRAHAKEALDYYLGNAAWVR